MSSEGPACPICSSTRSARLRSVSDRSGAGSHSFELFGCPDCELCFVEPELSEAELAGYYPAAFYGARSASSRTALWLFMQARLAIVQKAAPGGGRLLDVGAGAGDFLAAARGRFSEVVGMEPSAGGRDRARALGLSVHGSIDEVRATGGQFEVITMWQVAEHVRKLVELLRALRGLLRPGGCLIVAVPNAASLESRLFKDRWFHLDVPRHQLHFSARALDRALDAAGLAVDARPRFSIETDPFGLIQSIQNCLPIEHNALYQVVKHGRSVGSFSPLSRAALRLSLLELPIATALAVATEAGLSAFGLNGTLTAVARSKPSP